MTNQTAKTAATKTAKAFKWTEENAAIIVEAYQAKVEESEGDATEANTPVFLQELAEKVGASGVRSVRQKLAQQGVYIKAEAKKAEAGQTSTRVKKVILADLIATKISEKDQTLGDAVGETFASLEHAGRPALLALLAFVSGRPMGSEDLEA